MDLSIQAQLVSSDVASARMALVTSGGQEYLYFPNSTQSVRFRVKPTAFVYDAGWSQTYLTEKGDTTASSDVFMDDGVVFANNTDPTATTPMRVFAQDTAGSTLQSTQAFGGNSPAWNFFMMAGDPYKSGILAVEDQLNGRIAQSRRLPSFRAAFSCPRRLCYTRCYTASRHQHLARRPERRSTPHDPRSTSGSR